MIVLGSINTLYVSALPVKVNVILVVYGIKIYSVLIVTVVHGYWKKNSTPKNVLNENQEKNCLLQSY